MNAQQTPAPVGPTAADLQVIAELFQRFPFLFPGMDSRGQVTVAAVVDAYLADVRGEISDEAYINRHQKLLVFKDALGSRQVATCGPVDLKKWLKDNERRWPSDHTRAGVCGAVQRAFNWAAEMRIISENPFKGLRANWDKKPGRDMRPEEYQAILRHSDVYFRRFLVALKLTGARPCELTAMKWHQVDWNRALVTLSKHKTAKKTGKPRRIWLTPQVVKLLGIIRRDYHGSAASELRRILQSAPGRVVRAKEVAWRMRRAGFSYRMIYLARKAIGAVRRREGGWAEHGYTVYELPAAAVEAMPPRSDHVFLSPKRRPWTRRGLCQTLRRLRKRIGLPDDCRLYSLRHFFVTWAVKRGVNLKAVATLVGHATTSMVERVYAHVDGDSDFMHAALNAATALSGTPTPLPMASDGSGPLMPPDRYPGANPRPVVKKPSEQRPLKDCERIAYEGYRLALQQMPGGPDAADIRIYEWLLRRPEFAGQLPPSGTTFRRYLMTARLRFDGASKRKKRREGFPSPGGPCPMPAE